MARITNDICHFLETEPARISTTNQMKLKFSDLWRWDGTIDRIPYLFLGVVLFALKYNIDRLVALTAFGHSWSLFDYFDQSGAWENADKKVFYQAMVALALPFIWAGVVLTLRRLRSAGLPLGSVVLFFVPMVNLIFFALLSVIPPRLNEGGPPESKNGLKRFLDGVIPENSWGSAAVAILVTVILTLAGTAFSAMFLRNYGGGLFVGMPFCLGFLAVLIHGYHRPKSIGQSLMVCLYSVILAGIALLVVAFEGLICILMAAPIAAVLAMIGGIIAHVILRSTWWKLDSDKLFCTIILAIPALMSLEHFNAPEAPLLCVKTSVDVNAPPQKVWERVVSFSELPLPKEWLFRIGIAYPVRAEIRGNGVGAIRYCNFSTGPFVEPIEVWDEPHLLKFSVTKNPAPMEEWTPYKHLHPPHLDGFLASERGQFLLTQNKNGGTHLEGTTWYYHHLWPAGYWQIWSDAIIHRIHLRVLNHVKNLSENKASS